MTYKAYQDGFAIGSENEDGSHRADTQGWPYSIYRAANEVGVIDAVLCHGIQNLDDAKQLLALANGDIRPSLEPCQMFNW